MGNTIVAEESDDKVVAKGNQVEQIAKEQRYPVVAGNNRHEQELNDIQPDPDRKESADGDIKAVSEFELLESIVPWRAKQALSLASSWKTFDSWTEELSDKKVGGGGYDEGG